MGTAMSGGLIGSGCPVCPACSVWLVGSCMATFSLKLRYAYKQLIR